MLLMKKISLVLSLLMMVFVATAQNSQKLLLQKDGYGTEFTYIGEVKNGKPEGKGIAIYTSGDKQYGIFKNGMANGRCIFLYANNRALVGNYVNGKPQGDIVFLRTDGSIYIGGFSNDNYSGYAKVLTQNNLFTSANYKAGKKEGKGIEVGYNGVIFDGMYANDMRNGPGLQYEPKQQTLYEGIWKDDKWVGAEKTNLQSFIKRTGFKGFAETDRIVASGPAGTDNLLKDSCLVYKTNGGELFFGTYTAGFMSHGFHVKSDSSRYWGGWTAKGGSGYGVYGKAGNYLGVGNFKDGSLDGSAAYINIARRTIYDGELKEGKFTGKATFINAANTVMTGEFLEGSLNGAGSMTFADGIREEGTYVKGKLSVIKSITRANGELVNCTPKTIAEALNLLFKQDTETFSLIKNTADSYEDDYYEDHYGGNDRANTYGARFSFPGAVNNSVTDDIGAVFFIAKMLETTDEKAAVTLYKKLVKDVSAVSINSLIKGKAFKLKNTDSPAYSAANATNYSSFTLPDDSALTTKTFAQVTLFKNKDSYTVYIRVGDDYQP